MAARKNGRPSLFSDALADAICEELAKGRALSKICEDDGMPSTTTITRWQTENEAFGLRCARAREEGADILAQEIISIADTEEDAARARNRISARQWYAEKLFPRRYGQRQQIDANVSVTLESLVVGSMGKDAG